MTDPQITRITRIRDPRIAWNCPDEVSMHSFFRAAAAVALMGTLLLAYAAHPVAGWTTLVALAALVYRKKIQARPQPDSSGA